MSDHALERQVAHVYPLTGREHLTDGRACWCEPRVCQPCPVCAVEDLPGLHATLTRGAKRRDCSECGGSGVVMEYDVDGPLIVVHHGEARP